MDKWLRQAAESGSLTTDERLAYEMAAGINRLAEAINRLADAYLDVNLPEDEAEDHPTQSLSDAGR